MITVKVNGEERQYPQGATYEDVANDYQKEYDNLIALAARDGKIRELFKKLTRDCEITFFTLKDNVGNKTYVRSATMLFLKAVFDVYGREAAQNCRVRSGQRILYLPQGTDRFDCGQRCEDPRQNAGTGGGKDTFFKKILCTG